MTMTTPMRKSSLKSTMIDWQCLLFSSVAAHLAHIYTCTSKTYIVVSLRYLLNGMFSVPKYIFISNLLAYYVEFFVLLCSICIYNSTSRTASYILNKWKASSEVLFMNNMMQLS